MFNLQNRGPKNRSGTLGGSCPKGGVREILGFKDRNE
jgi:hypothetical protein